MKFTGAVYAAATEVHNEFENEQPLILVREDILQRGLELHQNRFELIQRDVVLATLNTVQGRMRHPDFLGEIRVGKAATSLTQIPGKLSVEIPLHPSRLAK